MLNCTDLACVLHHHHFYAHLHQLKHHLQDDNDNAFTNGNNVGDNIQGILNETDSELSSQSPVDAPNDIIYIACGVVIAMILVAVIIVLVAITINKLRKREETSSASPATIEAAQTTTYATSTPHQNGHLNGSNKKNTNGLTTSVSDSNVVLSNSNLNNCNGSSDPSFNSSNQNSVWVFPPLPPQPNIYNCNHTIEAIMQQNEKHGFKGFRKQFSGRFKRFVAKKPQEPAPAIPPELKPQLKTIYVY